MIRNKTAVRRESMWKIGDAGALGKTMKSEIMVILVRAPSNMSIKSADGD